jgi:hypothetical protein
MPDAQYSSRFCHKNSSFVANSLIILVDESIHQALGVNFAMTVKESPLLLIFLPSSFEAYGKCARFLDFRVSPRSHQGLTFFRFNTRHTTKSQI